MKKITILLILLTSLVAKAQNSAFQVDTLLTSLYKQGKFNGNILIAEKGNIVFKKEYGLANESNRSALNSNSIFELASCSKQFTAAAIMILENEGKINIDDNISKLIPELDFYKGVTIRHLLNHTSGLPDYIKLTDSLWNKEKIATNNDIIQLLKTHKPPVLFKPNEKFEYSNTGYVLLATIIERASGTTYANFLLKSIFKPLKMKRTFVYSSRMHPEKIENYAVGYVVDKLNHKVLPDSIPEDKMVYYLDGVQGDGAVHSTVNDLLLWDQALYEAKLLSKNALDKMFSPAVLNDGTESPYGFGWAINSHPKYGKIAAHGGYWPGYMAYIEREIDQNKTFIILSNLDDATIPAKIIRTIINSK